MVDEISDEEWDFLDKVALYIAWFLIAVVSLLILVAIFA